LSALAIPHDDLLVGEIGVPAFPLWQRLGLLSFVVLTLPELGLAEIVDAMACDT
jgi:hypothetical protein